VVPALTAILLLISFYFTKLQDVDAAHVLGGPPSVESIAAWKVVASHYDRGTWLPLSHVPISLETPISDITEGITDDEGAWEARVVLRSQPEQTTLTIRRLDTAAVLLQSPVFLSPKSWNESFRRVAPLVAARQQGPLRIELRLSRATISSSFPEKAWVHVFRDEAPVPKANVVFSGDGISFAPSQHQITDAQGRIEVVFTATFPSPVLEIHATATDATTGSLQCVLPVRSGTLWIDPQKIDEGILFVASPVHHPFAYITVFDEHSRLLGLRLPLTRTLTGDAIGSMPLGVSPAPHRWVMVSPDPQATGVEPELLGWPLQRSADLPAEAAHVSTAMLGDGKPMALEAARRRSRQGRFRAFMILTLATAIEAMLIGLRSRNANQELESLLAAQPDIDESLRRSLIGGSKRWIHMLIAVSLIAVAFGSFALITWLGI